MHPTRFNKRFKKLMVATLGTLLFVALLAHTEMPRVYAQSNSDTFTGSNSDDDNSPYGNSNGGNGGSGGLTNPLGPDNDTLDKFLVTVIRILRIFAIPIIVLMIIYGGFRYVLARGNESQVENATRTLTYAIVGGLLILGAELILQVLQGTVNQLAP